MAQIFQRFKAIKDLFLNKLDGLYVKLDHQQLKQDELSHKIDLVGHSAKQNTALLHRINDYITAQLENDSFLLQSSIHVSQTLEEQRHFLIDRIFADAASQQGRSPSVAPSSSTADALERLSQTNTILLLGNPQERQVVRDLIHPLQPDATAPKLTPIMMEQDWTWGQVISADELSSTALIVICKIPLCSEHHAHLQHLQHQVPNPITTLSFQAAIAPHAEPTYQQLPQNA
ncbi:MAG: hypothetical protein KME20_09520 [Kaiparowitsia implicata GSE-PSE-MK54-09C]|jgi:hypothetical protein|nr:hypothetical protein [Kaiparowitsia implicata GSE-PSE-MK54-09C]